MSNQLHYIVFMLLVSFPATAQRLFVDYPGCAGKAYTLYLKQGSAQDSVAGGWLDETGKAVIVLPAKAAGFRGVANLSVKNCRNTTQLILNGEDRIEVLFPEGSDEVGFPGSEENTRINNLMARQKELLEKYAYLRAGSELFRPGESAYFALLSEQAEMKTAYGTFWQEVKADTRYAARMMELLSCLTGTGFSLEATPETLAAEQKDYLLHRLDLTDLYTSGFWDLAMNLWYELHAGSDSLLLETGKVLIDRSSDTTVRREVIQTIIRQFSRYGKDHLLAELGADYLSIPLIGQQAPDLVDGDRRFLPRRSLIFFYDYDCGSCHRELQDLLGQYALLSNAHNAIRVISVAADTDRELFEEHSKSFPWADKLCDFEGLSGENFHNYGVVGTPTFVLTDEEGIVRGRYAQLKEFLKE